MTVTHAPVSISASKVTPFKLTFTISGGVVLVALNLPTLRKPASALSPSSDSEQLLQGLLPRLDALE